MEVILLNRNAKSHFSATDNRINIGRSRFNRNSWWKGTAATGKLIPFYIDEVLPGDSFDMKTSVLARMSTPIFPVMDNSYIDTYFFFVPNRLVWDHWQNFMGQNDVNAWENLTSYSVPQLKYGYGEDYAYSLVDYFGLPFRKQTSGVSGDVIHSVSALPFRAYNLIWNEWFRDQNLQDPILIDKGDSDLNAGIDPAFWSVKNVNKYHDYFTSALPSPQKGNSVLIPGFDSTVPIITKSQTYSSASNPPMSMTSASSLDGNLNIRLTSTGRVQAYADGGVDSGSTSWPLRPNNLYVGSSSGVTIDALRRAFQIQKLLWRDGNGGTRYTEMIRSHFGVVSPDARLQRPEYLGGKRIPVSVNQVIQQSATDNVSPQGNASGFSKTVDTFNGFQKSFTEHGFIIGLCCVRTDHTYQQGINRMWSRTNRFDYYWPEFANLGEQSIRNKEIFWNHDPDTADNEGIFGYSEAWAEYRYRPSFVTSSFRSDAPNSLDAWHYADDYAGLPYLSAEWIAEGDQNVARTLAYSGENDNEQWLFDFYFDLKTTRPMPVYSVPGLVDHF